jgi:hypothetical protein
MLGALFRLCDNVEKLDIDKIFITVIYEDEVRSFIVGLNRFNQLYEKGETADGDIAGYYSYATEVITEGKKKAGQHYNFFDTGEMYNSFKVQVYSDATFDIYANTLKDGEDVQQKILSKGAGDILGLTGESMTELGKYILPHIIKSIKEQILNNV